MSAIALALLCAAADPLAGAKASLAKGDLDAVLFAVQDAPQTLDSADVLAEAGRQALEKKDQVLALQFVQMALRQKPKHALALEVGAQSALAQNQFDPAESYGDRWIEAEPKNARARLLRAEIAIAEGEWSKVVDLVGKVDPGQLSTEDRARALKLMETSKRELKDRKDARAQQDKLEAALESEVERIKKADAHSRAAPAAARSSPAQDAAPVILYGTSWCGFCKKAARWLTAKGVPFVEKDIEKDAAAAQELEEKKRAAGRSGDGVPWIDVHGQLVDGFDQRALEQLL